ncbi:MAG: hypothetical protein PHC75_05535 [Burkholderiales bacterium]|nr:hypothetical protein [Burkholderiales bacterium]
MPELKFKLLIDNISNNSFYKVINDETLSDILECKLYVQRYNNKPYIFSCFATSVDGRLCYPDATSGFTIAKYNNEAISIERYADWWNLSLGRAISDAVIIGSNSILGEHGKYIASVDIKELRELRGNLGKPEELLHIIITRDANKIDWQNEEVVKNPNIPLIIFSGNTPRNLPDNIIISDKFTRGLNKQLILDETLNLLSLINLLYENSIKTILNESPYYHHYLQEHKLLDEAWLNTSGVYIGGNIATLGLQNLPFTALSHPHYSILTLHHIAHNFLYTRYKVTYS